MKNSGMTGKFSSGGIEGIYAPGSACDDPTRYPLSTSKGFRK